MSETEKGKGRRRVDGREAFLVYLDPNVILALKKLALDRKTHAYLIVEDVLRQHVATSPNEPTS